MNQWMQMHAAQGRLGHGAIGKIVPVTETNPTAVLGQKDIAQPTAGFGPFKLIPAAVPGAGTALAFIGTYPLGNWVLVDSVSDPAWLLISPAANLSAIKIGPTSDPKSLWYDIQTGKPVAPADRLVNLGGGGAGGAKSNTPLVIAGIVGVVAIGAIAILSK